MINQINSIDIDINYFFKFINSFPQDDSGTFSLPIYNAVATTTWPISILLKSSCRKEIK